MNLWENKNFIGMKETGYILRRRFDSEVNVVTKLALPLPLPTYHVRHLLNLPLPYRPANGTSYVVKTSP
jgi:hypothetical protein